MTKKKIFTITGPSCAGKTSLARALLDTGEFTEIVSFTSRAPRGGEEHGKDYYFLPVKTCKELVDAGETAEAICFKDNWYGITKAEIDLKLASDKTPLVIVEPQGLVQLAANYPLVTVYIDSDLETLYTRFLTRLVKTPEANMAYEARRVAAIALEHKEWPDKVIETVGINLYTSYYEGHEEETINTILSLNNIHNKRND